MTIDPYEMKYLIKVNFKAEGIIEKPDIIGAIFGQTEGLLGEEMNLRDLQKSARVGRIEVNIEEKKGKTEGEVTLPASLDKVEVSVLASSLETIDRVGPCKAQFHVTKIEDVRGEHRTKIIKRAKELLSQTIEAGETESKRLIESVRDSIRMEEITYFGQDHLPAGPHVKDSDAIIVVEGRNDVLNLLKHGIRNAIAVEGTNVPRTIVNICKEKIATAFVDGDRGGGLILKELLQVAEIDFIARAPPQREVEELTEKLIMKSLKNKIPTEQYVELYGLKNFERKTEVIERKTEGIEKNKMYSQIMNEINKSFTFVLLDKNSKKMRTDVPVHDLVETLKNTSNVDAVIFDGIITQRLIDVANQQNVKTIVGVKKSTPLKIPHTIKVLTKEEV
jgi:DNA primase